MTPLDPRFSKVVALMRSTQHAGEQKAARSRAEAMAVAAGMTLEEALAVVAAPTSEWFFDIFDRKEDAADRSWKAEQAARRRAKIAAWTIRRAALIAKYGSIDAATAPCERERLILAAVARWRTVRDNPRWTHTLDGWTGWASAARKEAPAHVIEAIEQAYPLPTTFAQAEAEHDYWTERNQELEDAFSDDGDCPWRQRAGSADDDPCRRSSVPLAEHELPVTNPYRSPRALSPCTATASRTMRRSRPRSSATSAPWLFVKAQVSNATATSAPSARPRAWTDRRSSSRLIRNGPIVGSPGLADAHQRRSARSGALLEPCAQTDPSSEADRSIRSTSAQPLQSPWLLGAMIEGLAGLFFLASGESNCKDPAACVRDGWRGRLSASKWLMYKSRHNCADGFLT